MDRAGINERTARRWQQLADVPEAQFEDAVPALAWNLVPVVVPICAPQQAG